MTDPQGTRRAAGSGLQGTIVLVGDFSPVQFLESRLQRSGDRARSHDRGVGG